MKVYIVTYPVPGEDTTVASVFATRELAERESAGGVVTGHEIRGLEVSHVAEFLQQAAYRGPLETGSSPPREQDDTRHL